MHDLIFNLKKNWFYYSLLVCSTPKYEHNVNLCCKIDAY